MSNFQVPHPCPSTSKIFPPPWTWTSNFKRTTPLPSTTNYEITTALCMWTHEIKATTKQSHVTFFKGWLHCLTPESIGRFLVNNILIFDSAWCLVIANPIFFDKIRKNWTSRTLYPPHLPMSDNISFFPYPPPPPTPTPPPPPTPLKWTPYVYHSFIQFRQFINRLWSSIKTYHLVFHKVS